MIAGGDVLAREKLKLLGAIRNCTHFEFTVTNVDTLFEVVVVPTGDGPMPMLICGLQVPSPELGKTLLASVFLAFGTDQSDYDTSVHALANQLAIMRESTMERLSRGANGDL